MLGKRMDVGSGDEDLSQLTFRQRYRPSSSLVQQFHDMYVDSIAAAERVSFSDLMTDVRKKQRWLFTAEIRSQLAAFIVVTPLPNVNVHLLEYMAVAVRLRNRGTGSMFLEYLVKQAQRSQHTSGFVIEVESDEHGTGQEKHLRKRRIKFYQRNGAHLVKCAPNYQMPNQVTGSRVGMKLMWLPVDDSSDELCGQKLRDCIVGIYQQSFGRARGDKMLEMTLEQLVC